MSDQIKREDAIEAVHGYWKLRVSLLPTKVGEYGEEVEDTQTANRYLEHNKALCKLIKEIPSTEPKRGKWINEHEDGRGSWVGTCDQCNKENHVDNFCSNCGADMRGAE